MAGPLQGRAERAHRGARGGDGRGCTTEQEGSNEGGAGCGHHDVHAGDAPAVRRSGRMEQGWRGPDLWGRVIVPVQWSIGYAVARRIERNMPVRRLFQPADPLLIGNVERRRSLGPELRSADCRNLGAAEPILRGVDALAVLQDQSQQMRAGVGVEGIPVQLVTRDLQFAGVSADQREVCFGARELDDVGAARPAMG